LKYQSQQKINPNPLPIGEGFGFRIPLGEIGGISMGHFVVGLLLAIIITNSVWFIFFYNKIANKKTEIEDSWRQIDNLMRQRHDLILNCVETICSSAICKEKVLDALSQSRNDLLNAQTPDDSEKISKELIELVSRFFMDKGVPSDIEAKHGLLNIWHQIEELEGKLALKQQIFNGEVFLYNKTVNSFPNSIAAKIMNIKEMSWVDL
jgi:LemA protein